MSALPRPQILHSDDESLAAQISVLRGVVNAMTRENMTLRKSCQDTMQQNTEIKATVVELKQSRSQASGAEPTAAAPSKPAAADDDEDGGGDDDGFGDFGSTDFDAEFDGAFDAPPPPSKAADGGGAADTSVSKSESVDATVDAQQHAQLKKELSAAHDEIAGLKRALDERTKALLFWSTKVSRAPANKASHDMEPHGKPGAKAKQSAEHETEPEPVSQPEPELEQRHGRSTLKPGGNGSRGDASEDSNNVDVSLTPRICSPLSHTHTHTHTRQREFQCCSAGANTHFGSTRARAQAQSCKPPVCARIACGRYA